jgi:hypothetical protein
MSERESAEPKSALLRPGVGAHEFRFQENLPSLKSELTYYTDGLPSRQLSRMC